jgi:hypothetical protein
MACEQPQSRASLLWVLPKASSLNLCPVRNQPMRTYLNSIKQAIAFLNQMMDAYASGSTVRLIQSYADQSGLESTAFTYNNAMSIHALMR